MKNKREREEEKRSISQRFSHRYEMKKRKIEI
jgi:hypothetical protein